MIFITFDGDEGRYFIEMLKPRTPFKNNGYDRLGYWCDDDELKALIKDIERVTAKPKIICGSCGQEIKEVW